MATRYKGERPSRNTAPLWKKLAIVVGTLVVLGVVLNALNASKLSFLPFLAVVVVVVVGTVWLLSKLLGVHLSLRSWD